MGIGLQTLLSKLKQVEYEYCYINEGHKISRIKFLMQQNSFNERETLYLSKLSELLAMLPVEAGLTILCIEDCKLPWDFSCLYNVNIILTNAYTDILDLFNEVTDILHSEQKKEQDFLRLLNAVVEDKGLQHIVDVGFELLGNPILISDLSHKLLAYTKDIDFGDPIWNELVQKGYRTYSIVASGTSKGLFEQVRKSRVPIVVPFYMSDNAIMFMSINIGNKSIGYISVVGALKPFDEKDSEIMEVFSKVLAQEMLKNSFFRNSRGMLFEYFIMDLLDNKIIDTAVVEERMRYLNITLKENNYIVIIHAGTKDIDKNAALDIQKEDLEHYGRLIIYNDNIVLLLTCDSEITNPERDLSKIYQLISVKKMKGGISRSFHSLIDIRKAYEQALKAIEIASCLDNKKVLYLYEDYAVYHLISMFDLQDEINTFCHPSLYLLAEYDRRHDTNLLYSLYVYLCNDKKLVETAAALYVHRNTLSSRIEKISEIMKVDLRNPQISFHLLLSFKIIVWKHRSNKKHTTDSIFDLDEFNYEG